MASEEGAKSFRLVTMDDDNRPLFNCFPSEYDVVETLIPYNEGGFFMYEFEKLERPSVRTYPDDAYEEREDGVVYFALSGEQCVGQIHAYRWWNGMLQVNDLRVRRDHRGRGIARALTDAVTAYARERGYPALRLETQASNAGACRFYAHYGFWLMGVDLAIYQTTQSKGDTALYWYHPLVPMEQWQS